MVVRGLYSSKLRAVPYPYQKLVPLNALLPVALRYPLQYLYFTITTEGINFKSIKKAPDRSQEPSNTGANCSIAISVETKVSGIALQPEESTTQPDFPTNVELHFNIDRPTLSTV